MRKSSSEGFQTWLWWSLGSSLVHHVLVTGYLAFLQILWTPSAFNELSVSIIVHFCFSNSPACTFHVHKTSIRRPATDLAFPVTGRPSILRSLLSQRWPECIPFLVLHLDNKSMAVEILDGWNFKIYIALSICYWDRPFCGLAPQVVNSIPPSSAAKIPLSPCTIALHSTGYRLRAASVL